MKRTPTILAAGLLAALIPASGLWAASQARLTGVITDPSGKPVDGATITLTTPSLTNFKVTFKSDKAGKWATILNDATLTYHVKIEKEGFAPSETDKKIPIGDIFFLETRLQPPSGTPAQAGAAAAPSTSDQAILAFNTGVESLHAGDKAGAETHFLEAAKKNPDLPAAWQALTQMSYEKKDWAKTLEYGRKATDLDPSLSNVYAMLADAAKQSGDAAAAAEWSAKNAEANPEANAKELYNKGKMKEAEASLTKAVAAKPDFAQAHYLLGMAAFNQNKKEIAKEHLSKYLELEPTGKEAATVKEILPLLK